MVIRVRRWTVHLFNLQLYTHCIWRYSVDNHEDDVQYIIIVLIFLGFAFSHSWGGEYNTGIRATYLETTHALSRFYLELLSYIYDVGVPMCALYIIIIFNFCIIDNDMTFTDIDADRFIILHNMNSYSTSHNQCFSYHC